MARVTVEDCLEKVNNRFEMVLLASERARQIEMGDEPKITWDNDKPTVVALREIADGIVTLDSIKSEAKETQEIEEAAE